MGNAQSGVEDGKESNSHRNPRSEQQSDRNLRAPYPPVPKESRGPVTGRVPLTFFEDPYPKDHRSQQDLRQAVRSEPLAPANTHTLKQNDFGDKGIDLETAISLLQQLKKTASPGDLIALRK
jgi:hypothetical protein